MRISLSKAANRLQGQPMFKLLDKVSLLEASGKHFIHFEIGDPNFESPHLVKEMAIVAITKGHTHYSSSSGIYELKNALKIFYRDYFNSNFLCENVVIAPGCNPLIHSLFECCVEKNQNVIITDPCFPTYQSSLEFLGLEYKTVPLREKNSFCVDVEELKKAVDKSTKMIVLNSPNNPTGSVMPTEQIREIIDFAHEKGILVLCDEIYSLLNYNAIYYSAAEQLNERNNVIVISGFSKPFAMSGWRIGYMIADKEISDKISLYLQTTVSCTNTISQHAAIAALSCIRDLHDMKVEYMKRRNLLVDGLNSIKGISCLQPMGAFYAFANVSKTGLTGEEFCSKMMQNGVALLPGTSFGTFSKEYVRFCFTRPMEEIEEGLNRVRKGLGK